MEAATSVAVFIWNLAINEISYSRSTIAFRSTHPRFADTQVSPL